MSPSSTPSGTREPPLVQAVVVASSDGSTQTCVSTSSTPSGTREPPLVRAVVAALQTDSSPSQPGYATQRITHPQRCALLQRTALRCNRCNRLQQSAVGCNRRHCVATGCAAGLLQRIALCCNHRCYRLQRAAECCNRLWSNPRNCGTLRSLQRVATRCGPWQRTVVCCNRLCCVASGQIAAALAVL